MLNPILQLVLVYIEKKPTGKTHMIYRIDDSLYPVFDTVLGKITEPNKLRERVTRAFGATYDSQTAVDAAITHLRDKIIKKLHESGQHIAADELNMAVSGIGRQVLQHAEPPPKKRRRGSEQQAQQRGGYPHSEDIMQEASSSSRKRAASAALEQGSTKAQRGAQSQDIFLERCTAMMETRPVSFENQRFDKSRYIDQQKLYVERSLRSYELMSTTDVKKEVVKIRAHFHEMIQQRADAIERNYGACGAIAEYIDRTIMTFDELQTCKEICEQNTGEEAAATLRFIFELLKNSPTIKSKGLYTKKYSCLFNDFMQQNLVLKSLHPNLTVEEVAALKEVSTAYWNFVISFFDIFADTYDGESRLLQLKSVL